MSKQEALLIASKYGLEREVAHLIHKGYSPEDALKEWDCYIDN